MREYTVSPNEEYTQGKLRTVQILVHDSHEAFLHATGWVAEDDGELYVGSTHSEEHCDWLGRRKRSPNPVAVVHFFEGGVSTEAIAHEMVHVALAIYRSDVKRVVLLDGERDEIVAYLVGDLTARVSRVLRGDHRKGSSIS